MLKVLIISDEDVSLPFRANGCEARVVRDFKDARDILLNSVDKGYGIVLIAESIARGCMDIIAQISETKSLPVITIIPDLTGKGAGAAEERIRQLIKRAVGIELPE